MRAFEMARLVYERRKRYFEDWESYARRIKEIAEEILGEAKVYVFGSIVEGNAHPALSDIDVLIVSPRLPKSNEQRAKIIAEIKRRLGPFNPFEIHLATPGELEWYRRFTSKLRPVN